MFKNNSLSRPVALTLLAMLSGVAIWGIFGLTPILMYHQNSEHIGQIGDSFGIVNSFFSSLGFSIATVALLLQITESHEQMRLSRESLLDGRKETARITIIQAERDLKAFQLALKQIVLHDAFADKSTAMADSYNDSLAKLLSNEFALDLVFDNKANDLHQIFTAINSTFFSVEEVLNADIEDDYYSQFDALFDLATTEMKRLYKELAPY